MRLQGSVGLRKNSCVERNFFITSGCAPTDNSADKQKDDFYAELVTLVRKRKWSDTVLIVSDFNVQVENLVHRKLLWVGAVLPAQRTDNG